MMNALVLALAATAAAMPAQETKSKPFGLAMKVDGSLVSLNAAHNTTAGSVNLEAQRLSVYPGTPTYYVGTAGPGKYVALDFDIDGQAYGLGLPNIGSKPGYAASAFATIGKQDPNWQVISERVYHKFDAKSKSNQFYACKDHVGEEQNYFLKVGNPTKDGKAPAGCVGTDIYVNRNMS